MTLPAPNLDDRRFQDLVDEAKLRIPEFLPEWTNHNVADPGVALIELFAWLSEQTLFRANQLPDRLFVKFLDLVGVELFPPLAASTSLTFWLGGTPTEPASAARGRPGVVVVPGGTPVGTAAVNPADAVIFSTVEDLVIRQPDLVACVTNKGSAYVDRLTELRDPVKEVTCFEASPLRPGDFCAFGLQEGLPGHVLRLDVQAKIRGIGIEPPRPPLSWEAWDGERWAPLEMISDSTGGLNRQGSIVLVLPDEHPELALGTTVAAWIRVRLIEPEPGQEPYRDSPRLEDLRIASIGASVPAEHSSRQLREVLGVAEGRSTEVFTVRHAPVLLREPGETLVSALDGVEEEWAEVDGFAASGPDDRHFTWTSTTGEIRFGPKVRYPDGTVRRHGAHPKRGSEVAVRGYRTGGGARGNIGAGSLTLLHTTIPGIQRVENRRPATGGVDGEDVENAKIRGPQLLATGQRAVTAGDFERLTMEAAPEIARVRCVRPPTARGPIRLYLVPKTSTPDSRLGRPDLVITDELYDKVGAYLEPRRVLGTAIEVLEPRYLGVSVVTRVVAMPNRPADAVRQRVLAALYRFVNPVVGGREGKGWPFDADVSVGAVFQLLSAVDGVQRVEEAVLFEVELQEGVRVGEGRDVIRINGGELPLSFAHQVVVQ